MSSVYDAVVVGAGPNGLAAAITLAEAGWRVIVFEGSDTIGGGARTAELTLPGFKHDICSAIHALAVASPFFQKLDLAQYGLEWVFPDVQLAHPFDGGTAAAVYRSLERTAQGFGEDEEAYRRLIGPLLQEWGVLGPFLLGPFRFPCPRHLLLMARFGLLATRSGVGLATSHFATPEARGFFAGVAAHSIMALDKPVAAAFGLVLTLSAHAAGWPLARGGSQQIVEAMATHLRRLGGEIVTGCPVQSLDALPPARATLLCVSPRALLQMAGERLPALYRRQLQNYRYGPGVCKVDWALSDPIPWSAEVCRRAGTVHVGGSLGEIALSERQAWDGQHAIHPFVLVVQPTLFDESRAPAGKHTAWAYCHVPNGSTLDVSERITAQVERFAPGFRDCILAQHTFTAAEMASYNPNYIGGDINVGVQDAWQLFTRPAVRVNPYKTPVKGLYLCSSATPPGGGVHGMSGYHAAQAVLSEL